MTRNCASSDLALRDISGKQVGDAILIQMVWVDDFFFNLRSIQDKTDIAIIIILHPLLLRIGKYQVVDTNGY